MGNALLTSKNLGIKFSKNTPLESPLIPCTTVKLLAVRRPRKEKNKRKALTQNKKKNQETQNSNLGHSIWYIIKELYYVIQHKK